MKNLKSLLLDNISIECNREILEKELDVLKSISNNKDLLLEKQREYNEKYVYLSESFAKEFKLLNEQHYAMRNALKDTKFKVDNEVDNDELKELLISSEYEVLKNIKETFQTIVDKKEKTLHSYRLLKEIVKEYFYVKEELVS